MYVGAVPGIVLFLPGLLGIFWGAPLITRELENGTHRLVWNQGVTRTRWMAVKPGLWLLLVLDAPPLLVGGCAGWELVRG